MSVKLNGGARCQGKVPTSVRLNQRENSAISNVNPSLGPLRSGEKANVKAAAEVS